jgi:hypothetical protein
VKFTVKDVAKKNYEFRSYQYVIVWMKISLFKSATEDVADIECAMSLIDIKYLFTIVSETKVITMLVSINVQDIENVIHQFNAYVMLNLYLNEIFKDRKTKDHIRREFHIVNDLKCRILMKLNIMTSKKMIINLVDKSLIIFTCENLIVSIRINSKSNSRIKRIIHSKEFVTISFNSVMSVSIYMREKKLSFNKDYLFESNNDVLTTSLEDLSDFYTHVCDCNMIFVHVRNDFVKSIMISSRTRLKFLIEYEKKECFQIDFEMHEWTVTCDEAETETNFS